MTARKFKRWDKVRVTSFDVPTVHPLNRPIGRTGRIYSFYDAEEQDERALNDPLYQVRYDLKEGETRESLRGMANLVYESQLELIR